MSSSDQDQEVRPPRVRELALSALLLVLFAPVVLAVGSAAFRPGWLLVTVAGVPLSVLWVLGSILIFIALTWLFARAIFARVEGEQDQ